LNNTAECLNGVCAWKLTNKEINKPLVLNLFTIDESTKQTINIISAQTQHGYYELHNVVNYIKFEPDEIIFIAENNHTISCLIVGASGACSLFSNINRDILKADFTELPASEILAAMQLSIVDYAEISNL